VYGIVAYCRENFLKIHLFYGDISYNSVKQSPAYDKETLLGMNIFLSRSAYKAIQSAR